MQNSWQLQEAKSKFSHLIEEALNHGPQTITRRGRETAILLSIEDYQRLLPREKPLSSFFHDSPLGEIHFQHENDELRDIEL